MPTKERSKIELINENAKRLDLIRDQKSVLENEEKELKAFFEGLDKPVIETSAYLVVIAPQSRETVSLKELMPVFGDKLNPYINTAYFNKITVKAKK